MGDARWGGQERPAAYTSGTAESPEVSVCCRVAADPDWRAKVVERANGGVREAAVASPKRPPEVGEYHVLRRQADAARARADKAAEEAAREARREAVMAAYGPR